MGVQEMQEENRDLRSQIADFTERLERAEDALKPLNLRLSEKERENFQLDFQNKTLENQVSLLESELAGVKKSVVEMGGMPKDEAAKKQLEILQDEREERERKVRDLDAKLRLSDVKATHFERKVEALERQNENWEEKYEELERKYKGALRDLEELAASQTEI